MKNIRAIILSMLLLFTILLTAFAIRTSPQEESTTFTIVVKEKEKRVDILANGKPFTSYVYPDVLKKPVLYPLRTTKGSMITRGWPLDPRPGERVDHPHHMGLWFNYGDVNGHDFWNNSNDTQGHKGPFGTIRHNKINKVANGKNAELAVIMDWQKPDNTNLLREDTRFVFSGNKETYSIDRITTLTALKENVSFTDNKEGLIAIRLARELEHPSDKAEVFTDASGKATSVPRMNNKGVTGKYISSEGKTGDDVWGTRANWVNLNGRIGQEDISLVILDNPKNIGFPTHWHARGYGLFAANPLGQQAFNTTGPKLDFKLSAGQSVTFRHRILIHSGDHYTNEQVDAAFQKFSAVK